MCVYHTSKRVQQGGIHKFRGATVSLEDDDVVRGISVNYITYEITSMDDK
jgi:hypothetical protein